MVSAVGLSLGNTLTTPLQSACTLTSSSFLGAQVCPFRLAAGCKSQNAGMQAKGTGFFKLPGTLKRKASETAEAAKPSGKPGSILQKAPKTFQLPGTKRVQGSDPNTVFVAGATGKVGIRTVRELSALGFKVRAGVRNVQKAEEALAFASQYDLLTSQQARNIQLVEYDLEDPETFPAAIGNAGKVVAAIGAGESSASDVKGPYKVDGQGAKALIRAAVEANVAQFVMVSSLGAGKVGFPAALLNLFWGVLVWKRQAEVELEKSGMAFTIVRPGGMERPGDDYKRTHNIRLAPANTEFGGQVSQLQVAEVIGAVLSNPELSENKIVEVVAETSAPVVPLPEQLKGLPVTGLTQAERAEKKQKDEEEAAEKKRKEEEEEAKREEQRREAEARAAEEAAEAERKRVEVEEERERQRVAAERRQEAARELQALRAQEADARREADAAEREAQQAQQRAERLLAELQEAAQAAKEARAVEKAALQAARQGQVFGSKERADVIAEVRAESRPAAVSLDRETKRSADEAKTKAAAAKKKQQAAESARVKAEEDQKAEDDKEKAAQEKEKADAAAAMQRDADAKKSAEAKRKEEQSAKEAEARKAEEEKKKQAEAKKAEEETKKKEAEAKAEKEAEAKRAKAKQEEDKKKAEEAKAAEAAKKKKDEEEKVQAKARADAEAQAAADKKTKEEEERKKKEEQAKKDAAAKAKTDSPPKKQEEEKPKVTAAVINDIQANPVEPVKSLLGGFRWPWQAPPEEDEQQQQKSAPAAKSSTDLPPSPTPLSPYTMYDELKPPTTPVPPGGAAGVQKQGEKAVTAVKKEASKVVGDAKKEAPKAVDDAKSQGTKIVDDVKKEGSKAVNAVKKESPKAADDAKKEGGKAVDAVKKEGTKIVDDAKKEAPKATQAVKDAAKEAPKAVENAGDSLPDAAKDVASKVTAAAKDVASKVTAAAKDAQKSEPVKAVADKLAAGQTKAEEKAEEANEEGLWQEAAKAVKGFKWPWKGESEEGEGGSGQSQTNGAFPRSSSLDLPYANRPLSPYTQYADLKPPTSPMPSPPVEVKNRAENDSAGTESSVKKTLIRD